MGMHMSQVGIKMDDDIGAFAHHCVYMRSVYLHGKALFETSSAEDRVRMSVAAPILFPDINRVLIEYTILQVCRITDAAKDRQGNENHTVAFLLAKYDFSGDPNKQRRLADLNGAIQAFREKLLPARHKRIAHADRGAVFDLASYGQAPDQEWSQFWLNLQDLVLIIYEKVHGEPFYINGGMLSDADGLLKALKEAACFTQLINGGDAALTHRCADAYQGMN
jgi:hypothetical protein